MGLLSKKKPPEWVAVAQESDFSVNHQVTVGKNEYALFKLDDGIYCTQNSCSHEYSPLSKGLVMDGEVFCEKHGSRFDIRSGKVINLPATEPVKTFPVKVQDGTVYIFVSPT
jgi:3-phenylpropionate/trans-cinnamate dioxygenase ferredoxin subunit